MNTTPLTPAEALARLAGAITYMQSAGLRVRAGNDSHLGLVLAIEGARVTADSFGVMRFEPMPAASLGSTSSTEAQASSTAEREAPAQAHG